MNKLDFAVITIIVLLIMHGFMMIFLLGTIEEKIDAIAADTKTPEPQQEPGVSQPDAAPKEAKPED